MWKFVSAAGLLLLLPVALIAQETPKAELYTGYSYLRLDKTNLNGWNVALDGVINKNLGIVADVSGYYNSQSETISGITGNSSGSIHSILVGPRVVDFAGRWSPFAQALFGWSRFHAEATSAATPGGLFSESGSSNAFSASLGGGIDFKVNDMAAIRVVQIDYFLLDSNGQKRQGVRLGAGLVFLLGNKK